MYFLFIVVAGNDVTCMYVYAILVSPFCLAARLCHQVYATGTVTASITVFDLCPYGRAYDFVFICIKKDIYLMKHRSG